MASALKKAFEVVARQGPRKLFGRPVIGMELFCQDMTDRGVAGDKYVTPIPSVQGQSHPEVHCNLSMLDMKAAFVTGQIHEANASEEETTTINFDEFVVCLARCGHTKYEEVEQMTLPMRAAGIVANFLGLKTEQQVLTEAIVTEVKRFDAKMAAPIKGQTDAEHRKWLQ
eukprot:6840029-Prymnesium_polylepis.1